MGIVRILIYAAIGIAGGVIGGMGMGGGTLLIPLLTLFTDTPQHVAQAVNLVAFIPMSVVALVIHAKNKLIDFKYLLTVALPAVIASVPASILVKYVGGRSLSRYFGIFLTILGVYQLVSLVVSKIKERRAAAKNGARLYKTIYK